MKKMMVLLIALILLSNSVNCQVEVVDVADNKDIPITVLSNEITC